MAKRIHISNLPEQEYLDTLHVLIADQTKSGDSTSIEVTTAEYGPTPNWLFDLGADAHRVTADQVLSEQLLTAVAPYIRLVVHGASNLDLITRYQVLLHAADNSCAAILASLSDLELLDSTLGDEWIFLSCMEDIRTSGHSLCAICWCNRGRVKTNRPSFSVMTPLYNHGPFIEETLRSIQNQSYEHWEVVVVNDGSTDDGPERVAKLATQDDRIRLINKPNGGVATALNCAIDETRHDWLAWLSSDDLFLEHKLALHAALIRKMDDGRYVSFTNSLTFTDSLEDATYPYPNGPLQFASNNDLSILMSARNIINGITPIVHRGLYQEVGKFDTNLKYTQDYDMWTKLLNTAPFIYLPNATTATRLGPQQTGNRQYLASRLEIISAYYTHLASISSRRTQGFEQSERTAVMKDVVLLVSAAANPRSFFTAIGMGNLFLDKAAELLEPFVSCEAAIQNLKRDLYTLMPSVPWSLAVHADIDYLCSLLRERRSITWNLRTGLSRIQKESSIEEIRDILSEALQ